MTNIKNRPKFEDLPNAEKLMHPTLVALERLGGSATRRGVDDKIVEMLKIPDSMLALTNDMYEGKNSKSIIYDQCGWARTRLKRMRLVESGGFGIWVLTQKGRQAATSWTEDHLIDLYRRGWENRMEYRQRQGQSIADETVARESWRAQLLEVLQSMDPSAFERLSRRLLLESGFDKVKVTGRMGDGGIDGTGMLQINLLSFPVLFQCKRYRGAVGTGVVRDFRGAMIGRTDKGLIITTGTFTRDARAEATRDGAPPIDLIDGEELCDLLKAKGLGVTTEMVEHITVHENWFAKI